MNNEKNKALSAKNNFVVVTFHLFSEVCKINYFIFGSAQVFAFADIVAICFHQNSAVTFILVKAPVALKQSPTMFFNININTNRHTHSEIYTNTMWISILLYVIQRYTSISDVFKEGEGCLIMAHWRAAWNKWNKNSERLQIHSFPCVTCLGICNILRHLQSQCWRVGGHALWNGTLKHSVIHLKTLHLTAEYQAGGVNTDDKTTGNDMHNKLQMPLPPRHLFQKTTQKHLANDPLSF